MSKFPVPLRTIGGLRPSATAAISAANIGFSQSSRALSTGTVGKSSALVGRVARQYPTAAAFNIKQVRLYSSGELYIFRNPEKSIKILQETFPSTPVSLFQHFLRPWSSEPSSAGRRRKVIN